MSQIDHKSALPTGYQLQEYVIESLLGHGGFGLTYLARDINLDKLVAIKEYMPQELAVREGKTSLIVHPRSNSEDWHRQQERFAADALTMVVGADRPSVVAKSSRDADHYQWGLQRFLAEAQTLARFKHPNIVRVLRYLEAHNTAYLVMEYEQGQSLGDYIRKHGAGLDEEFLRKIFIPILEGLSAVHDIGLLHRDIKPDNIYLRTDASPMLIDFGSARYALGSRSRSMSIVITAGYAPFEQYSSVSKQGPWTDVYGIGASLYYCLTGETVPDACDRSSTRHDDQPDLYKPVREFVRGHYSEALLDAVDSALAFRVKERPQTAEALRLLLTGEACEHPVFNRASRVSGHVSAALTAIRTALRRWWVPPFRVPATVALGILLVAIVVLGDEMFVPAVVKQPIVQKPVSKTGLQCEKLAGSIYQSDIGVPGVPLEKIDSYSAIPACEKALGVEPDEPKFKFLLGRAYHAGGDYIQALNYIRQAAEANYPAAEGSLGWMYENGKGVTRSLKRAQVWYRRAAEHGNPYGQSVLGWMYAKGIGVAKDSREAVTWFRRGTDQGLADAQNNLGVMYRKGDGVERDTVQAVEWFRLAAEQGLAIAQNNLGDMYRKGEGVEKDAVQAVDWYRMAAEQGLADAQFNLSAMYANGEGVGKDRDKARYWYKKAVK